MENTTVYFWVVGILLFMGTMLAWRVGPTTIPDSLGKLTGYTVFVAGFVVITLFIPIAWLYLEPAAEFSWQPVVERLAAAEIKLQLPDAYQSGGNSEIETPVAGPVVAPPSPSPTPDVNQGGDIGGGDINAVSAITETLAATATPLPTPTPIPMPNPAIAALHTQIEEAKVNGNIRDGENLAAQLLELDPNDPIAHVALAEIAVAYGWINETRTLLDKSLEGSEQIVFNQLNGRSFILVSKGSKMLVPVWGEFAIIQDATPGWARGEQYGLRGGHLPTLGAGVEGEVFVVGGK